MANSFHFDINGVLKGLASYSAQMYAALDLYGDTVAQRLQSYARSNKPWENRTSNAMQSILGKSKREGDKLIIQLSGGMDYSPYLEFCNNKKYAILYPTINLHKKDIMAGMKNLVR